MAKRMYQTSIAYNWREEDDKHPATHILLSLKEYDKLLEEKKAAEAEANNWKVYANQQVQKVKKEEAEAREKTRKLYEEDKDYQWKLLEEKDAEIKRLEGLNDNLLRMAKERANAERKMKPKKERSGYRLFRSGATKKNIGYNKNSGAVYASVWETVLESPYEATLPLKQIDKEVFKDLKNRVFPGIGVSWYYIKDDPDSIWKGKYDDLSEEEKKKVSLFDYDFSINPKTYRWMISLITTSAVMISRDLMA